jgi:Flp pilus assembly protein TadG
MARFARLRDETEGSALLEFAIALPLLVVFIVGIYDFSGAFNQKQKIQHAAQVGAIVAGAQPTSDIYSSNANPGSLQPVVEVIFRSLAADNLLPLANQGSCKPPAAVAPNAGLSWTYTMTGCPDAVTITIARDWVAPGGDTTKSVGTQVTVTYPYQWRFNSAIQLLFPGASYAATTDLKETSTVHNQM